ncbi:MULTISPECIES: histidine kinase [unclassified Streptomyces]|uniref:sensor histidine kinase n=1 Tax=unclassified Streptomyces TaxID=2593676 RepID=UPI00039986FF|nr:MULTISPECIES: histidine kinase [unclassified Streptomyces]MYY05140.1 two-component sensor histidine kinase [Streptomyces sp. SID4913]
MRLRGWHRSWQERGKMERIDQYSRFTICAMPWLFTLAWQGAPFDHDIRHEPLPLALGVALLLVSVAQCVLSNRNLSVAYEHYLGTSVFPGRRLLAPVVLMLLAVGLLATLTGVDGVHGSGLLLMALNAPMALVITRVLLVPVRRFVIESLCLTLLTTGALAASGLRGGTLAGVVPCTLFGCVLVLISVRPSAWSMSVMWQAEQARDIQARLAVAEERLRFGRDMHDVMGRNLAVIALKSELAVELAQRGRPEAVDQMVEVQRIARASQQEVRDVVRGYREASLITELAGAQGVLSAAGIECVVSDGTGERLPAPVQAALGWVVREAATNVLRHGDPRRCVIRLETTADSAVLHVENDGVTAQSPSTSPSTAAAPDAQGSGLAGLRERLGALDGSLEAGPAQGGLFRLTATVPLGDREEADRTDDLAGRSRGGGGETVPGAAVRGARAPRTSAPGAGVPGASAPGAGRPGSVVSPGVMVGPGPGLVEGRR